MNDGTDWILIYWKSWHLDHGPLNLPDLQKIGSIPGKAINILGMNKPLIHTKTSEIISAEIFSPINEID